ncbi:MAG: YceD family protein [Nitrospiraceae bacterium]
MRGDFDASGWGSGTLSRVTMDVLIPKIADITAEGLSLSGDLTGEELALTDADVCIRGPLAIGLDLRAVDRTICVTGVVEGTAIRQCVRCLKDFDEPMAFSLHVAYEREAKTTATAAKRTDSRHRKETPALEAEPEEQNDDLYYYVGDHLELAPMLREQLILASPMHPLCSEECLGLCPRCGKDLNEGPCRCSEERTGNPFQVLRTMKEKLRDPGER